MPRTHASGGTVVLLISLLAGCSSDDPVDASTGSGLPELSVGSGQFAFRDERGNAGRPILVRYHMPDGFDAQTPIVVVMHGASRDGPRYFADWEPEAERYGFLLLVPEFSDEHYPGSVWYNLGNRFANEDGDSPRPVELWTYTAIEHLFDAVRDATGSQREAFRIYGHSAGGQFVHRYLLFDPDAPIERAVAANAGWYTLPVDTVAYPYGLDGSGQTFAAALRAFSIPTTVLLGDQDVDSLQSSLRRTPEAIAQGPHRFARGHTFYDVARSAGEGVDFAWVLDTVPGASHSDALMAPRAAEILGGN